MVPRAPSALLSLLARVRLAARVNSDTVSILTNARVQGRYEFQLETQTTMLPRN